MKIRDRIIQYIKLLEYTVDLSIQRNDYQKLMNNIPVGNNSREKYIRNIKELDKVIGMNLLQLQRLKENQLI